MSLNPAAVDAVLSLAGEGISVEAVPVYAPTRPEAKQFLVELGFAASLILTRGEDEVLMYFALTEPVMPEAFPTVDYIGFHIPGQQGWDFARNEDEEAAAAGTFVRYTAEELAPLAALPVGDDDGYADTVEEIPFDPAGQAFDDVVADLDGSPVEAPAEPVAEVELEEPAAGESVEAEPVADEVDGDDVVEAVPNPDEAAEPAAPAEPTELPKFLDAFVHGDVAPEVLQHTITHGYAADGIRADYKNGDGWDTVAVQVGQFLAGLARHKVGPKEGSALLQGEPIDRKRDKNTIRAMGAIAVDLDNGTAVDAVVRRLKAMGRFAIIYTTHSHMSASTARSQNDYVRWAKKTGLPVAPTDENLARYLVETRGYLPEIAQTVRYVRTEHTVKGLQILITHAPMPKFRVILPLAEPFVFADVAAAMGISQQDAIKLWGRKIFGLGRMLDVHIDESCIDPSRLFYFPRHDEGRPFEVHVIAGTLLSIDEVQEIEKRQRTVNDPFAAAAEEMGGERSLNPRMTDGGIDLVNWDRERREGFELGTVFETYAPEKIRGRNGLKYTVECPFDGMHGNAGNEEDPGCFVCNASESETQSSYTFKCMHGACADRKRVDMVAEALRLGWFPEDALLDDDFNALEADIPQPLSGGVPAPAPIDREGTMKVLLDRVMAFTPETSSHDIQKVLRAAIEAGADGIRLDEFVDRISKRTKWPKKRLDPEVKAIKREVRRTRSEEDTLRSYGITPRPGTSALIIDTLDDYQLHDRSKDILAKANWGTPRVFDYNGIPYRSVLKPGNGALSLKALDEKILTAELMQHITYYELGADGAKGVYPPPRLSQQLLVDTDLDLPRLEGFSKMPFLSKDGHLVQKPGYDHDTGIMLTPPDDLVIPEIPEKPTREQALAALERLRWVFGDFPFDDGQYGDGSSSWAHLLCCMLELYVRPCIGGSTPIYMLVKPSPGTGGSYAMEAVIAIATGERPETKTKVGNDEEIRKLITSIFLSGKNYFFWDNVPNKTPIDSPHWANLATAAVWSDRLLGGNEPLQAPNRLLKAFVGNNPKYSPEISRRGVAIRLDAKCDPLKRKDFAIRNFPQYVWDHRGELAACCLTIVKYWASIGMPRRTDGPSMASFESWCEVMGGILDCIGVPGFLANRDLIMVGANDERGGWEQLIAAWYARSDWHEPNTITNPEIDTNSLAAMFWNTEDAPEIPGVYGRSATQLVSNFRKVLKTVVDNVFETSDPVSGDVVEVRIRERRTPKGALAFYLERVQTL